MRSSMAACLAMVAIPVVIAPDARAEETVVPRYEGEVVSENLCAFVDGFFDHLDGVVGLEVAVSPVDETVDGEQRFAGTNEGEMLLYCVTDAEGLQVLVQGPARLEEGAYIVDGFYVVKAGGTHQGITAVGLEPVDDATAPGPDAKVVSTPVP